MSKNIDTIKAVDAAFAAGDTEAFLDKCSDDIVWDMVGEKVIKGKEDIRDFMSMCKDMSPTFTYHAIFGDDENVSSTGHMKMKDADGKENEYEFCDLYKFADGRISEMRSFVVKSN